MNKEQIDTVRNNWVKHPKNLVLKLLPHVFFA